jgi:hypothetical protein
MADTIAIPERLRVYHQIRHRAVEQYLVRLKWATLDRTERLAPGLRAYLNSQARSGARAPCRRIVMPVFPSVEWFNALKDIVNVDPAFRQLGTVDAVVGVKAGGKIIELTFEAFECTTVREATDDDLRDMDFWLEQPDDNWRDMLENIKKNGAADLSHTLNTIDLSLKDGFAQSHDGYRRDAFYRFNQSIQDFFNASAKMDTTFAAAAAV